MDVDEYRNMISEFSGLQLFDAKCSFYYDETGNVRKFRLTENGVNAEEGIANDFILGGVLFKGDTPSCDIEKFFDELNINSQEVKFKTLAGRGADFWSAISKKPIQQYFSWFDSSGLYVHYATLNNMYFSVVDMVDSLFAAQPQFDFGLEWTQALKASLHRFVVTHMEAILPMLHSYNYPSLDKDDIKDFCFDLSDLIQSYGDEDFYLENFRQLLKANGRKGELVFIEDNTPGLLVEEYSGLRDGRCAFYKDSMHYFDEEAEAELALKNTIYTLNGQKLSNFKFVDSKKERLIQISDVWVGLLGKLFAELDQSTPEMVKNKMKSLTQEQKKCIRVINSLIDRAERLHRGLIQSVNSIEIIQHRGALLALMDDLSR